MHKHLSGCYRPEPLGPVKEIKLVRVRLNHGINHVELRAAYLGTLIVQCLMLLVFYIPKFPGKRRCRVVIQSSSSYITLYRSHSRKCTCGWIARVLSIP